MPPVDSLVNPAPPPTPPPENSNLWRGIVSIYVMTSFTVVTVLVLTKTVPESPIVSQIVGALIAFVGLSLNYWMGSSAGSTSKNAQIDRALSKLPTKE